MSTSNLDPASIPLPKDPEESSNSNVGITSMRICGTAGSTAKLLAMINARRSGSSSELKITKKIPDLTGHKDFIAWRTMLLGLFVPYLGGRYWNLLEKDPSTSIEAYQLIFAASDATPISRQEAIAHRTADLIAIHGLLLQTLDSDVLQSVDEKTTTGDFDGSKLWDGLTAKYGGKDLGSKKAAEKAIQDFKLGSMSVTTASQQLQALFTQIYLATGGKKVPEEAKIEAILTIFDVPRFRSMRTTIQEQWQNGHPYTFDTVISRFVGEESLQDSSAPTSEVDGARALRTVESAARNLSSTSGGNRTNPARRRGETSNMQCWHCGKSGHRMRACRRRAAGDPPHPQSHLAREANTRGQGTTSFAGPGHGSSAASATHARLAALESSMQHATALLVNRTREAFHNNARSIVEAQARERDAVYHAGVPALANRISNYPSSPFILNEPHQDFSFGSSFGRSH
ncbi:hypothetical protein A4X13_0g5186 [Tilletia indica]|uniref:Uncharacterized protein n=1 Tax=Tilletia indica TaxID=43049 RepID=A0A177T2V8_9BASI|nr:hypothetical protein A4X13_0g5186 [Tilletia indica]